MVLNQETMERNYLGTYGMLNEEIQEHIYHDPDVVWNQEPWNISTMTQMWC